MRVSFENLITGFTLDENNCGGNSWLKEVGHRTLWKYDAVVVCAHTHKDLEGWVSFKIVMVVVAVDWVYIILTTKCLLLFSSFL